MEKKSNANSSNKRNQNACVRAPDQLFPITASFLSKLKMKGVEEFAKFLQEPLLGRKVLLSLHEDDKRRILHDIRVKYNKHQEYMDYIVKAKEEARDARQHNRKMKAKRDDAAKDVACLKKLLAQKEREHAEAAAAVTAIADDQVEKAERLKADAYTTDDNLWSAIDLLRNHIG